MGAGGDVIPAYCTRCGARAAKHFRFCQSCGAPLGAPPGRTGRPSAAGTGGARRYSLPFVAGTSIGVLALLIAAGIAISDMLASPGPQPVPIGTPTVIALATGTTAPNASASPAGTSQAVATAAPTAPSGPADTPSTDGPSVVTLQDSLTFDDQDPNTTSEAKTVTLSNEGGAAQPLGTPTIDGANPDAFAVSNNLCFDNLAAVSRCDLEVTFTPPSQGSFSATLEVVDPQGTTIVSVALSGTGGSSNPTADVSVSPGTAEFSTQAGITEYQSINVDNNGSAAINVSETLDDGGGVFSSGDQCNGEVAAGTTCTESIALNPPDQCDDATYSGSITFSDDAGDTLGTVSLAGTATGDSSQCQTSPSDRSGSGQRAVLPHPRATRGPSSR